MRPAPITLSLLADDGVAGYERRAREFLDPFPVAVYLTDGRRLRYVSERVEDLLGHPAEHWLDSPGLWGEAVHPDDRAAAAPAWLPAQGGTGVAEYRVVDRHRDVRRVRDVRAGVAGPGGLTLGLGVLVEIG